MLAQPEHAHRPAPSPNRRAHSLLRPLLLFLVALAATLTTGLLGSTAALSTWALGAQNRAGAFNPPGVTFAGGLSVENPCSRRDPNAPGGGVAAGCFVGDEDAAAADLAEDTADEAAETANSFTSTTRATPGSDGAESVIIKERTPDGETVQVVHQVGKPLPGGGTLIIHQHSLYGPLAGSTLSFPDVGQ